MLFLTCRCLSWITFLQDSFSSDTLLQPKTSSLLGRMSGHREELQHLGIESTRLCSSTSFFLKIVSQFVLGWRWCRALFHRSVQNLPLVVGWHGDWGDRSMSPYHCRMHPNIHWMSSVCMYWLSNKPKNSGYSLCCLLYPPPQLYGCTVRPVNQIRKSQN